MASIIQRGASWRAMVRRRGEYMARTFDTRGEAEAWAEREEARILAGDTPPEPKQWPMQTVAHLFARYAAEVSPEKAGWRWEKIRLGKLALDFKVPVAEIDGAALAEWRDKRLTQVSADTVNRELTLMSAVFTRAMKEWRAPINKNPVHAIQRPKHAPHRTRRVSEKERTAVLQQLGWDRTSRPETIEQWVAWTFCVALETMMRQGEILRLTWNHVHTAEQYCHLPKTKNGHPRDVPLSSRAVALFDLLQRHDDDRKVVSVNGGTFGSYFRRAVKATGISDLRFHDSRREALTTLAPKFGNPMDLGAASGHRDFRSLRIYYNPSATDLAKKLG